MSQAEEYEALVEKCAKEVQFAFLGDGKTATFHWGDESTRPLWHDVARAALAVIAEKAKEWPTEDQKIAARDWSAKKYGKPIGHDAAEGCWRAMFAASPLVKGEEDSK